MSRTAIPIVVLDSAGAPVSGASCTVRKRADASLATVYAAETGGTTVSNPLATDAVGRVSGWLDRGAYNLILTGSGFTGFTEPYDSAPAADGSLDNLWLPSATLPIGAIMPYAGSGDPSGGAWLLCDGRTLTDGATTHAALYGVIGTTFGGTGTSSFKLPDLVGRMVLGAGSPAANTGGGAVPGATSHTRGTKAGEETHQLTEAELAAHDHGADYQGFLNVHLSDNNSVEFGTLNAGGTKAWQRVDHGAGVLATTADAGGDTGHNNLPQHLVLNHVIRVL